MLMTTELSRAVLGHRLPNHPFADGNKRAGLLAGRAFLFKDGYRLAPEEAETVAVIRTVAAGDLSREELTEWVEANSKPIPEA
jgi:death-on-curing protein